MVGVIIIWTRAHNDVGFPLPDEPGDKPAIFYRWQQLAIVNIQNFAGHTQDLIGLLSFGFAPFCQRSTSFAPMPDVSIRDGDQLYVMSFCRPHRSNAASLDLAITRVSPKADYPQVAIF